MLSHNATGLYVYQDLGHMEIVLYDTISVRPSYPVQVFALFWYVLNNIIHIESNWFEIVLMKIRYSSRNKSVNVRSGYIFDMGKRNSLKRYHNEESKQI